MIGCPCRARDALCDRCVDDAYGHLRGVAMSRGSIWADHVRAKLGSRAPAAWPPFEGRCADIARRKVADLSADERLLERLARACWADAERRWSLTRPR